MIIVDRIEENYAVAEDSGSMINIRRNLLPPDVREGDVLVRRGLVYVTDKAATAKRRDSNRNIEKGLWK